ncbi:MAG: hypothetical protein JSV62_02720 [Promethearchaeota archaeon]|nr:MAG: hypothetical protein JSV62_02720 [Candidatus Lokiarchaeota archaeon]
MRILMLKSKRKTTIRKAGFIILSTAALVTVALSVAIAITNPVILIGDGGDDGGGDDGGGDDGGGSDPGDCDLPI